MGAALLWPGGATRGAESSGWLGYDSLLRGATLVGPGEAARGAECGGWLGKDDLLVMGAAGATRGARCRGRLRRRGSGLDRSLEVFMSLDQRSQIGGPPWTWTTSA